MTRETVVIGINSEPFPFELNGVKIELVADPTDKNVWGRLMGASQALAEAKEAGMDFTIVKTEIQEVLADAAADEQSRKAITETKVGVFGLALLMHAYVSGVADDLPTLPS